MALWRELRDPLEAPARLLEEHAALLLRGRWDPAECAALARAVLDARALWTEDFGGEQFSLGRAFYTHLETGRAGEYFAHAREADAAVERVLPGVQARSRALFAELAGGRARPRQGFCGAGVHVFPPEGPVAQRGGVAHWDVEGLAPEHLERERRALSLVVMLQPPTRGGGLRVWDALWDGEDEPSEEALESVAEARESEAGDVVLFASYRLHQILPFEGPASRLSLTLHGVEVDAGLWEVWF